MERKLPKLNKPVWGKSDLYKMAAGNEPKRGINRPLYHMEYIKRMKEEGLWQNEIQNTNGECKE